MLRRLNSGRSDNSKEIQVETPGGEDTKKSKGAGARATRSNSKGLSSTMTDGKPKHNFKAEIVISGNRNVPPKYPGKKTNKGTPGILLPENI